MGHSRIKDIRSSIEAKVKASDGINAYLVECDSECALRLGCPSGGFDTNRLRRSYSCDGAKDNPVVLIFSCPNKHCEEETAPIRGRLLKNVKEVFGKLLKRASRENRVCPGVEVRDLCLRNVWVNNASCLKHPCENEQETEPNVAEVEANVKRLWEQIQDREIVFCFGDKAVRACDAAIAYAAVHNEEIKIGKIVKCCHLGNRALNRITSLAEEQDIDRADVVARYLWRALRFKQKVFALNDFYSFLESENLFWRKRIKRCKL